MPVAEATATLADLARFAGKAELIAGRIVPLIATGRWPNRIAARIFRSLDDFAEETGVGEAYTDNVGFAVPELRSGRRSFSPDASYFRGPFPVNRMRFLEGPPTLAVEVRSEDDYGAAAEQALRDKRRDYFEAGTAVVWDVDPLRECIWVYRKDAPERPQQLAAGDLGDAEPTLPGWRLRVEELFR